MQILHKRYLFILLALLLQVFVSLSSGFAFATTRENTNLNVSSTTNINNRINNQIVDKTIELRYEDKKWVYLLEDIGVLLDNNQENSSFKILSIDDSKMRQAFSKIALSINSPPKNARILLFNDQIKLIPESEGIILEPTENIKLIKNMLYTNYGTPIILKADIKLPKITTKKLEGFKTIISTAMTVVSDSDKNRINNINLGLNLINGLIILPNQSFSFNNIIGPRLEDYGFLPASTIVKGNIEKDIGGGICQVSSTLYKAILKTDISILERHPHTILPAYSKPGEDATVVYGDMDLRLKNSTKSPIYISAQYINNKVLVSLLSTNPDIKKIKLLTSQESYNSDLGKSINLIKIYRIFNNDIENKELISEDKYPDNGILK